MFQFEISGKVINDEQLLNKLLILLTSLVSHSDIPYIYFNEEQLKNIPSNLII